MADGPSLLADPYGPVSGGRCGIVDQWGVQPRAPLVASVRAAKGVERMWSDDLTVKEAEYTERAMIALENVGWAKPLLDRVATVGGLKSANMPLLFEVRFAFELHLAGATADYEYGTGVGDSSVDFRIHGEREWLVELVSLRETQALKRGTQSQSLSKTVQISESLLLTGAADKQSEEDEMITALGKIGKKVFLDGNPTKFPVPSAAVHLILADMRGYLGEGGDVLDYQQMANGARAISANNAWALHFSRGRPILGLFEKVDQHPLQAAAMMRERVHFLGFIAENEYRECEIRDRACYQPNPHLLPTPELQLGASQTYVLHNQ